MRQRDTTGNRRRSSPAGVSCAEQARFLVGRPVWGGNRDRTDLSFEGNGSRDRSPEVNTEAFQTWYSPAKLAPRGPAAKGTPTPLAADNPTASSKGSRTAIFIARRFRGGARAVGMGRAGIVQTSVLCDRTRTTRIRRPLPTPPAFPGRARRRSPDPVFLRGCVGPAGGPVDGVAISKWNAGGWLGPGPRR